MIYKTNTFTIKHPDKVKPKDIGLSPRISFYFPTSKEMEIFKTILDKVKPNFILDVGCGAGFLSYLLARDLDIEVIGIDPNEEMIEAGKKIYRHKNLHLTIDRVEETNLMADIIFNSWMPSGVNLTPYIKRLNPKVIIFVSHRSKEKCSGVQTGLKQSYNPRPEYKKITHWYNKVTEDRCKVEVWSRKGYKFSS
ncbi:methyltransferase domain-containing protein [Candidatus Woesearchaeota archaeon]|nr:methyltransferase domain-containing protein [Candidatus Woesearchaeota archaeon]